MIPARVILQKERSEAHRRQLEGFESSEIFKLSVESKLQRIASGNWWINFQRCGRDRMWSECASCGHTEEHIYQCSSKWCPRCNWKITARRQRELRLTTAGLNQVKHLVLTQKNFPVLTRRKIMQARANLLRLRRQKFMGGVRGGSASLEFTNENKGWHMHWHLLLDCDWIKIEEVSKAWGTLVAQEFAIVKVKAVNGTDYLKEVCKYVVTGQELARWDGEMILQFIHACRATRMFTTFGTFTARRQEARRQILREKQPKICKCGCGQFKWGTEESFVQREHRSRNRNR